jgi:predicted membrane-bound spermidine synthase
VGRAADRSPRPLRLYALVEALVALSSLLVIACIPALGPVMRYLADGHDSGSAALPLRFLLAAVVLALPCALIGGTLPIMVRYIVRDLPSLGERIGLLYYVNTMGAAIGVFVSGLFLIEVFGVRSTGCIAAALNLGVAALALLIDRTTTMPQITQTAPGPQQPHARKIVAACAFFAAGCAGIGLEIAWTRVILGFLPNGSVVITTTIGLFLVGLAAGGLVGSRFADRMPAAVTAAVFLALAAITAYDLGNVVLFDLRVVQSPLDIVPIAGLLLPSAVLMGALFPLLTRILVDDGQRVGGQLGGYYALNTVGCVVGGIAAPFVVLPRVGTSGAVLFFAGVAAAAGCALWIFTAASPRVHIACAAFALAFVAFSWTNRDTYHAVYHGIAEDDFADFSQEVSFSEGAGSTVVLYKMTGAPRESGAIARYRIQVDSSPLVAFDTNETKVMAHLPLIATPSPARALVICFGMGNTFRSALAHDIDVDVVDINAAVPPLARLHQANPALTFEDPRGRIIINDGRNYLLMTPHRYDMITVDPAPPIWGVGMVNLHTQEFFELARDRLTDDGVMLMWALANEPDDFLAVLAAFRQVFPHVVVARGMYYAAYHLLGSKRPINLDGARAEAVLARPRVRRDLDELTPGSITAEGLLGLVVGHDADVDRIVAGVEPLTDDHPTLEYRFMRGFRPRGASPFLPR